MYFLGAAVAAVTLVVIVTTVSCISLGPAFGYAAAIGILIGLGAGWARRVV